MKNFPLRKNYILQIKIKKKVLFISMNKTILLKFQEANIKEIIEFLQSDKNIINYFSDFILSNSNATKKDLQQILLNFDIIWEQLNNTYFRWLNQKWNVLNIKQENNNENENENKNNWWFSSYVALISEKMNIDPISLLEKYTLNQLNYLTEWIIYNANEQTDKWKEQNRMNVIRKQRDNLSDTDAQKIKDFIYSP